MTKIYGHETEFNLPLEVVARELGDDPDRTDNRGEIQAWENRYARWLQDSDFGSMICFVDITFAPVGAARATAEVSTLIVGSSTEQKEEYGRRLEDYLKMPASLNAHPVFGDGLPVFENNGLVEAPETAEQLRQMQNPNWKLKDDRFLLWSRDPAAVERKSAFDNETHATISGFSGQFIQTFKKPIDEKKIPRTISENWKKYVSKMTETGTLNGLRAARTSGQTGGVDELDEIGILVAAPIGVRSQSSKKFTGVADVFFGLSRRASPYTAEQFLRFLALHLLRSNVGFNQRIQTHKRLLGLIGHEVKKVAVAITEEWAPKAESLFDIAVSNGVLPGSEDDDGHIGRIELKPGFDFLRADLGILPFRSQLQVTSRSLRFWSYTNKITDQPFPESHRSPESWLKLVEACWEAARQQITLFALGRSSANTPALISQRWAEINAFRDILEKVPQIRWDPVALQDITCRWGGTDEVAKRQVAQSFALSRILIALFGNCLQHGDPSAGVTLSVTQIESGGDEFRVQIANRCHPREFESPIDSRAKSIIEKYESLINDAKAFSKGMMRLQGSTEDVVNASLEDLGGGNLNLPNDKDQDPYSVVFTFHWRIPHD